MDPAYVLLAVIVVVIPLAVKAFKEVVNHCNKIDQRMTVVETKLDIFLDHNGFDVSKVNKTINEHIGELKKNDKPSVGCINVKELYRDKEG